MLLPAPYAITLAGQGVDDGQERHEGEARTQKQRSSQKPQTGKTGQVSWGGSDGFSVCPFVCFLKKNKMWENAVKTVSRVILSSLPVRCVSPRLVFVALGSTNYFWYCK